MLEYELSMDARWWAIADRPSETGGAVLAIFPIADSLTNEPTHSSQRTRARILSRAVSATEYALHMTTLSDSDLVGIQLGLGQALAKRNQEVGLDRELVTEGIFTRIALNSYNQWYEWTVVRSLDRIFTTVMGPPAAENALLNIGTLREMELSRLPWFEVNSLWPNWEDDYTNLFFMTPDIFKFTHVRHIHLSGLRTQIHLEVARVALAAERYRLAHGAWPDTLESLVPEFIDAIPLDIFEESELPLKWRYTDGGEFEVYSRGYYDPPPDPDRNPEISFTLSPPEEREQNRVAAK